MGHTVADHAPSSYSFYICSGTASFLIVERESGKKMPEPAKAITDAEIGQISEKLSSEEEKAARPTGLAGFFAELKVFKNPQFLSLTCAELAASIGFLIPMYYFQSKLIMTTDHHHLSVTKFLPVIMILNVFFLFSLQQLTACSLASPPPTVP